MRTAIQYALAAPPRFTPGALYRPHCVHRLDKPTSGLLLCAKTKPTLLALQRSFAERRVQKRYSAIVGGQVEGDEGEISLEVDGKVAVTRWHVVHRARSLQVGQTHLTELALYPKTGRTHQLRKHCALALGCPIVGDKSYGGTDVGRGLFLAAVELTFQHPARPADAPPFNIRCDAPAKFGHLLSHEHGRWERLHRVPRATSQQVSS